MGGNVTVMAQTTLSSGKDVKGLREIKKEQEKRLKEKKEEAKQLREEQQKGMIMARANEELAGNADINNKKHIPFDVTG